jgi:hypothetical protein
MRRMSLALLMIFCLMETIAQPPWVLQEYLHRTGSVSNQYLGKYVAGIGDYNRDGKPDVAVASMVPSSFQIAQTGIWYVTANTDTLPNKIYFGQNMKQGDINGDGYRDLIIVKSPPDASGEGVDTVQIYFGNTAGVDSIPGRVLLGENRYDFFGYSEAIGDINGDGINDLVVTTGIPEQGRGKVYVYFGRNPFPLSPDVTFIGDTARAGLSGPCGIGDINDDGVADLVVAGQQRFPASGDNFDYINIYYGSAQFDTIRDFRINGIRGQAFGGGLAVMDANGDGKKDIVWAYKDSTRARTVRIYYGRSQLSTTPDFILPQPSFAPNFGSAIANAGDMDGDGYGDIAVGDWTAFGDNGVVLIYRAGPALDTLFDAAKGTNDFGNFGRSLDSVGDVNGDGLSDIIVGAFAYPFGFNNGFFGVYLGDRRITSVRDAEDKNLPEIAKLDQNYPNPFNPTTDIRLEVRARSSVTLSVFDLLGRQISVLVKETRETGTYNVAWDATQIPSGVYFYRLTAASADGRFYSNTKKAVLIK